MLSVRALSLVLPNWNGYKKPQTVWNWRRKKLCSHPLALSRFRQMNEQAKMKCYYNSDAVPSAIAACHITFNYYCIKNDKGFSRLELTKWVSRAHAHIHTPKSKHRIKWTKIKRRRKNSTRDSSIRKSEWINFNTMERNTLNMGDGNSIIWLWIRILAVDL